MWVNSSEHVLIIDYPDEDEHFANEQLSIFQKINDFIIETSK